MQSKGYLNLNKFRETNAKAPLYWGRLEVGVPWIKALVDKVKSSKDSRISLAVWEGESRKDGSPYLYISLDTEVRESKTQDDKQSSYRPQEAPTPDTQQAPAPTTTAAETTEDGDALDW